VITATTGNNTEEKYDMFLFDDGRHDRMRE